MVKTTLSQIVNSVEALNVVMALKIKAPVAYRLAIIGGELSTHVTGFNRARQSVFAKYGQDGVIPPESRQMAQEEIDQVLAMEVDLKIADKIRVADLEDEKIEPEKLMKLLWLLEE